MKIKVLPWDHEGEKKEVEVVKLERLPEEFMQQETQAQGGVEPAEGIPHEAGGPREVRLQPELPGMPSVIDGHHQAEARRSAGRGWRRRWANWRG